MREKQLKLVEILLKFERFLLMIRRLRENGKFLEIERFYLSLGHFADDQDIEKKWLRCWRFGDFAHM